MNVIQRSSCFLALPAFVNQITHHQCGNAENGVAQLMAVSGGHQIHVFGGLDFSKLIDEIADESQYGVPQARTNGGEEQETANGHT